MPHGETLSTCPDITHRPAAREMKRAEKCARTGKLSEAIASLDKAMQLGADRYTCYLRQARLYQEINQLPDAVEAAEHAIAENPERVSAREAIISLHLEARDYTRAANQSRELIKIAPRHVPARDALGAAYMAMGDIPAAIRVATDLIRLDPANANHRYHKAHLCQHLGDVRTAVQEFERVIDLTQDDSLAEGAREQLNALDAFHIHQIIGLCCDDLIFLNSLRMDPENAVDDRGFCLSASGLETLQSAVEQFDGTVLSNMRPALYH